MGRGRPGDIQLCVCTIRTLQDVAEKTHIRIHVMIMSRPYTFLKGGLLHKTLRRAHSIFLAIRVPPQLFPSKTNVDITSFICIVVRYLATPSISKGIGERSLDVTSCRCAMDRGTLLIIVNYLDLACQRDTT